MDNQAAPSKSALVLDGLSARIEQVLRHAFWNDLQLMRRACHVERRELRMLLDGREMPADRTEHVLRHIARFSKFPLAWLRTGVAPDGHPDQLKLFRGLKAPAPAPKPQPTDEPLFTMPTPATAPVTIVSAPRSPAPRLAALVAEPESPILPLPAPPPAADVAAVADATPHPLVEQVAPHPLVERVAALEARLDGYVPARDLDASQEIIVDVINTNLEKRDAAIAALRAAIEQLRARDETISALRAEVKDLRAVAAAATEASDGLRDEVGRLARRVEALEGAAAPAAAPDPAPADTEPLLRPDQRLTLAAYTSHTGEAARLLRDVPADRRILGIRLRDSAVFRGEIPARKTNDAVRHTVADLRVLAAWVARHGGGWNGDRAQYLSFVRDQVL